MFEATTEPLVGSGNATFTRPVKLAVQVRFWLMLARSSTALVLVEQLLQPVKRKPSSALAVRRSPAPWSTTQLVPVHVAVAGTLEAATAPLAGFGKATLKRA